MFWKNTAWSWDDAAENDGGGYLLTADLRRTPDSAPDSDLNCIATSTTAATTANQNHITTSTGLKDLTNHSLIPSHPYNLHPTIINCSSCVSTLFINTNHRQATPDSGSTQRLTVSVVRGKDGFGFTICSDCPVRVQAVDPGGPAHRSGLCQGDSVLQLNGLPVETWKCVDLAHAIRSCSSQMVLVVWRGLPELRSGCEALLHPPAHSKTTSRKLLPHPAHSTHGCRRGWGSGVRSSLRALGSLWRDRKEDCEEEEEEEEQEQELLQPVYHDRSGTIGCLYQTHPGRDQNLLHNPRPGSSRQLFPGSTLPLPPSTSNSSSAPRSNYGNYQNCTIVQSHLPCSAYGTYVTLTPKTLIFPIFVQPLDLCSPDRTLLMSEEMVLHQADLLPAKVTVLIYSDLLLFTREDEAGCCNVLRSPLYLNTLQLREVASEPLHIYFLQSSQGCWCCVFSLEAFSIQQRVRVSLCLHDNIKLQLVATETRHSHQLSDLPSDFGLLSVCQPDLFYGLSSPYSSSDPPLLLPSSPSSLSTPYSSLKPSSPCDPSTPFSFLSPYTSSRPPRTFTNPPPTSSTQRSPVWRQRGVAEEEGKEEERRKRRQEEVEERQLGEGESTSETSENLLLGSHHFNLQEEEVEKSDEEEQEEEEEGGAEELISYKPAVLRRSLSEGSLLKEPPSPRFLSDSTIHRPPPIHPLRKQLTTDGWSLHHMLLSLNGTKDTSEFRNFQLRTTTPSAREVLMWAESLEDLLTNQYGLAVFHHFLRLVFSEEKLDFWLAVERFKRTRPLSKMVAKAVKIYNKFISTTAVNVDSAVRELTNQGLCLGVNPTSFQLAQDQIFDLMETDSYPRFLKSRLYAQLTNQSIQTATETCNQSRVGTILVGQS